MLPRVESNLVHSSRCPSRVAVVVLVASAATAGCSASSTTTVTPTGPDAVKCQVSLAHPSVVDASGGTARFSVATQPECAWDVSSAANWISGLSPASGQGNSDVEFRVAANDGSSAREGEIVVNNSRVLVSQRAPCRYDVGPQNQSMNAGAGAGSVTVTTQSECTWTATTDVGWIRLSPPLAGNGNGSVGFTVASNGGAERTGSVIIAGQQSVVTQAAAAGSPESAVSCTFTISPTSQSIGVAGGNGTAVTVSTQAGCLWTAASNAAWITVTSGSSGNGNGSVGFTVDTNTGAARTGTLTIGGRAFTVTQAAAGTPPPSPSCTYSISPNNLKVEASGGTRAIAVATASGCSWTARSHDSWITITGGASSSGNGTVTFTVAPNNGKKRTGTLTIAGRTARVEQEESKDDDDDDDD